jgi:hypothetical protein
MFDIMGKSLKKQPLGELAEMLKTLQEKEKIQDHMVRKFQKLIRNKSSSFSVIEGFPYPMAIFEQDGDLVFVNSALSEETGLYATYLSQSKHSLLNRITDANLQILDAVENVFMGKTTFLTGLSDPMELFTSDRTNKKILSSEYREAVLFPITCRIAI